MPKISVIIPCYNQGQFIDETVNSVLNQTFRDFEIIIVNDGSTDTFTIEKLRNFDKPKTRVIHIPNGGSAIARNTGFKASAGEFIQFLDADDLITPVKFEKQLAVFAANPATSVCYSNFSYCNVKGEPIANPYEFSTELSPTPLEAFLFKWERGITIAIHCFLVKREVWGTESPFDERLRSKEDWVMWSKLALRGLSFFRLPEIMAYYRTHNSNKCRNFDVVSLNFFKASVFLAEYLPDELQRRFLDESFVHIRSFLSESSYYKELYHDMTLTSDYRIGKALLSPYRAMKKLFTKRNRP